MKKYLCEFIGTAVLVLFGCGSAAIAGSTLGTLGIALAFGLSIVAMAYVVGNVSGCHINPAVSLAMLISKKMSVKDFICYVVAQVLGAIAGTAILYVIIKSCGLAVATVGLGANGFGEASSVNLSMFGAIIVEVIYSILPCPNGCSLSGFLAASLVPTIVIIEDSVSLILFTASKIIAIELVIAPIISFRTDKAILTIIPKIPALIIVFSLFIFTPQYNYIKNI